MDGFEIWYGVAKVDVVDSWWILLFGESSLSLMAVRCEVCL